MTDDESEDVTDLSEADPSDISVDELEEQDWTLGQGPTSELIEFKGMQFLVEDPEDDTVINMMAQGQTEDDGGVSQRMYELCNSAIKAPELPLEKWRDMRMSERVGLTFRISNAIGLADMMDFPANGPQPQQAE